MLKKKGIIPGIKLDKDVVPLFLSDDEVTTQGKSSVRNVEGIAVLGSKMSKLRDPILGRSRISPSFSLL